MSIMIAAYGGYVLKYVGDAILVFFVRRLDAPIIAKNSAFFYCLY